MPDALVTPGPAAFTLRARGIRKSFADTEVLHGVDVDIVGGRVLALLGENGAGKSTLVKVVAGVTFRTPERWSSPLAPVRSSPCLGLTRSRPGGAASG